MQDIFSKIMSDQETTSNFPRIDSMTRVQLPCPRSQAEREGY